MPRPRTSALALLCPGYRFQVSDPYPCIYARGVDLTTLCSRIDFADASPEDLESFFKACQPASFAFNNKDVFDETYRKAGKMNLDTFSTLFDPRSLGIHDVIEDELLATGQTIELELYKLNVYGKPFSMDLRVLFTPSYRTPGKDEFFKAHQDTPRGDSMFGTLVVVLSPRHEGGQLSLRIDERQWIVDFTDQFATAMEPSVCFVAFFGDVEHQVLPITSGYRITLTYNLHFRVKNNVPYILPGPFHNRVKQALVELVNDPETLLDGGYLGIGLCHQYVYDETKSIDSLVDKLKGSDAALASVCKELGLPWSLKLLYAQRHDWPDFFLLSRVKLGLTPDRNGRADGCEEDRLYELLAAAVDGLTPEDLEGVKIPGRRSDWDEGVDYPGKDEDYDFMKEFYKDPVPQVLEVKQMTSVLCETVYALYGNDISTQRFYGAASMIISVKPKGLRERLAL